MDMALKNGPKAAGLSGRQTEEIPFKKKKEILRKCMYLMSRRLFGFPDRLREQEAEMAAGWTQ